MSIGGLAERLTRWRRGTQSAFALLFLILPFGGARGFTAVAGTLGALQIGVVDLIEPAGALSAVLAGLSITLTLAMGAGLLILLAVVLGPVFCSWVCPWSVISEWLDALRHRGARRLWAGVSAKGTTRLRWATFAGLLVLSFVAAAPIASLISGPRLVTTLPLEVIHLHRVSWVTGGLLLGLLVLELAGPRRIWCRALCPAGAAIKLVRTRRTLGPVYDAARCADPRLPLCLVACPWGLDPRQMRITDGCTTCLACVDACGTHALVTAFVPVGTQTPAAATPWRQAEVGSRAPGIFVAHRTGAPVSSGAAQRPLEGSKWVDSHRVPRPAGGSAPRSPCGRASPSASSPAASRTLRRHPRHRLHRTRCRPRHQLNRAGMPVRIRV